jgi:hypothetical protein
MNNSFFCRSKRKENQEEKYEKIIFILSKTRFLFYRSTIKSILMPHDIHPTSYPPPPAPFNSRQDPKSQNSQQQGYQPYRFNSNQIIDYLPPTRHEPQIIPGKSSLSVNLQKPTHPPIPKQFLQANTNGSQSLRHHQPPSRSPYPPTFHIQPNQNLDFPIHTSQQIKRTGHTPTTSRAYLQFENPANV